VTKFGLKLIGQPTMVANVLKKYSAFPSVIRTQGGDYLCAHMENTSHYGVNGRTVIRRSTDLEFWSDPVTPPGQLSGFGWGATGLALDSGGRIYMGVAKTGWVPNSQTLASVSGYVRWSDDDGLTWSSLVAMPGGGAWPSACTFYPSGLVALTDGRILFSGYGGDHKVRFYCSDDRGATWTPMGVLTAGGRQLQEPQIIQLSDGSVLCTMRSDSITGDGSEYLYKATFDPGSNTWDGLAVITYDGGGCATPTEITPGWVFVLYRGFGDRGDNTRRPPRGLMIGPDWAQGNQDFWPNLERRYLYGKAIDGYLIFALEGPGGSAAPYAAIWSQAYAVKTF